MMTRYIFAPSIVYHHCVLHGAFVVQPRQKFFGLPVRIWRLPITIRPNHFWPVGFHQLVQFRYYLPSDKCICRKIVSLVCQVERIIPFIHGMIQAKFYVSLGPNCFCQFTCFIQMNSREWKISTRKEKEFDSKCRQFILPTRSLWGPTSIEFQLNEYVDGHSVYPSWCLLVNTMYFAPEATNSSAHWVALKNSAVKSRPKSWYVKFGGYLAFMKSWYFVFLISSATLH